MTKDNNMIINRRQLTHSLFGATLAGLASPNIIRAQNPNFYSIALPQFNGDLNNIKALINDYKVKFDFIQYSNHNAMSDKMIAGGFIGDLIVGNTSILSRLQTRGALKKLNMNNIFRFSKPEYSLVGKRTDAEWEFFLPFGTYFKCVGYPVSPAENNKHGVTWGDVITLRNYNKKIAFWSGDFNEVIRLANLALGLGYIPKYDLRNKLKQFILDNRDKWIMSENNQQLLSKKEVNYAILGSVELVKILRDKQLEFEYYFPNDGVIMDEIAIGIPNNSKDSGLAEQIINFLYQPQIHSSIIKETFLRTHNKAYYKYLGAEYTGNELIIPKFNKKPFENLYIGEDVYNFTGTIYREMLS